MRQSCTIIILLIIFSVSSCNQGNKGSANASLGNAIVYPSEWPVDVQLPNNSKPYRTKLVSKLAEGKVSNVSTRKLTSGGVVLQIGFEFPDGWSNLVSHFSSTLLGIGYVIESENSGVLIDYNLGQGQHRQSVRIYKEIGSTNYYTITLLLR